MNLDDKQKKDMKCIYYGKSIAEFLKEGSSSESPNKRFQLTHFDIQGLEPDWGCMA